MWHFAEPGSKGKLFEVAAFMQPVDFQWCFAGGWAIDLHLQVVTRQHKDIEIAIFRDDQLHLQEFMLNAGCTLDKVSDHHLTLWNRGELLSRPVHEIHATIQKPDQKAEWLEILLNERDEENWLYRRDPRVMLPLKKMCMHSPDGLPYLTPEIVLLYKAKSPRSSDRFDFHTVLKHKALKTSQKKWLAKAIRTSHGQDHEWLIYL